LQTLTVAIHFSGIIFNMLKKKRILNNSFCGIFFALQIAGFRLKKPDKNR